MIAISTDSPETQARFKASLKAPYSFIADSKGELTRLFDVKTPILNFASRTTFVVGPGRKVLAKQEGSDAIDPSGAVKACSLAPPATLKAALGPPDGGSKD